MRRAAAGGASPCSRLPQLPRACSLGRSPDTAPGHPRPRARLLPKPHAFNGPFHPGSQSSRRLRRGGSILSLCPKCFNRSNLANIEVPISMLQATIAKGGAGITTVLDCVPVLYKDGCCAQFYSSHERDGHSPPTLCRESSLLLYPS